MSFWQGWGRGRREQEKKILTEQQSDLERQLTELRREKLFLSGILSALVESVVAVDQSARILFINAAAENLFDVRADLVMGRRILEGLRHSALSDVLTQTLSQQRPINQEIILHSPEERHLTVNALPVDYGGGHTGVVAALHDVTELRKLERVRQEFVANASHELKTPLTAIKGFVETLLDGALEDPQHNRQFLETIQDHANHLRSLIDDLLDLSAIEAKRMEYRFESVALAEVAERIIHGLSPMAKAKQVEIELKWDTSLPRVHADREKLAQILLNLLDNAIKFNKPGGRVDLSAAPRERSLVISVTDTGIGITPQDLPRVFERFYRTDKSHSHDVPGTGLGLAIVKHLVEAHQGTVQAESIPGQGSTFTFTLPLA